MTKHLRISLIALHLLIGLSAVAAGQALARHPDGQPLGFNVDWLQRSPFRDYRVPGLFLAVIIGTANLLSALMQWRRSPASPLASLGTGVLLLTWLTIQTKIIGLMHWTQGLWAFTFSFTTTLALIQARRASRTRGGRGRE